MVGVYIGTELTNLALVPGGLYAPASDWGPGDFGNPQDSGGYETTQFSVTAGTTYYIQLGGYPTDGIPDAAANILLTWSFAGAGTSYSDWAATNAPGQTPGEDYNNDGVANGIAYFMGVTGIATNPGLDGTNTVTWPASATFSGTYEVQTSPDLSTWTNVTPKPTPADGNLKYSLLPDQGKLFVRLLVIPN